MLRLFVAIPLPRRLRDRLAQLRTDLAGARWAHPENYHLTLRFIGDAPEERLALLDQTLNSVDYAPLDVAFTGLGTFPNLRRPRVLFARAEPMRPLMELQRAVEDAVRSSGFDPEPARFRPHVTLARLRRPDPREVRRFVQQAELAESFTADEFVLFLSRLGPEKAAHEPVARFRLAP